MLCVTAGCNAATKTDYCSSPALQCTCGQLHCSIACGGSMLAVTQHRQKMKPALCVDSSVVRSACKMRHMIYVGRQQVTHLNGSHVVLPLCLWISGVIGVRLDWRTDGVFEPTSKQQRCHGHRTNSLQQTNTLPTLSAPQLHKMPVLTMCIA